MRIKFSDFSSLIFYFCYFFFDIVISEVIVRAYTIGFSVGFPWFMLLFAISLALFFGGICAAAGSKARTAVSFIFSAFIAIVMAVQLVYHGFCGSFMQVAQLAMGGDAMTAFGGAMWLEIVKSLGGIVLLLLPILALGILRLRGFGKGEKTPIRLVLCEVVLFFLLHFGAVLCLGLGGKGLFTAYNVYHDTFILDKSVRHFGVLTSLRLDVRNLFFGSSGDLVIVGSDGKNSADSNIIDIDFAALADEEEDEDLASMHRYFAATSGTNKNEYTGYFEGYNLIVVCVESFSQHLIDEELTPTLYKMATKGFVFTDYYNTVCDNTSNGEYALLTGLIPDTTLLGEGWKTFYYYNSLTKSADNFMPFVLGNQYVTDGANAYAVHNHTASYYGRNKTHPNMGYQFIAFGQGLQKVDTYPTSDLSMMEQVLPTLLEADEDGNVDRFHAYFLTFSGHMPYVFNEEHNDMTVKNEKYVKDLPYSNRLKAYIACQLEVEFAMEYMLKELEAAGVLDNTLIVLTNDHYPYPLDSVSKTDDLPLLSELAGYQLDKHFDKYRSGLIMWSASMESPVVVDVPCCSLDVLPTVSNLLGFTYDSRLLAGKDVFANCEHIAVLADRSFVTDKVMFNASSEEVILREGVSELAEGYFESIQTDVQNRFTMSNKILYNDYYRVIYE
ncbi:MAG: sulfatase-like hydrolase/transferase [Clostridia bacterium]|nr:sulfatase-like hydrolase/transferase [Clostridia bacterium]